MFNKLKFQERDILWLYIPAIKDVKKKREHSGLRPFLLKEIKQGYYKLATMTGEFKKLEHQYLIKYETNNMYQHRSINLNFEICMREEVLKRIIGEVFDYIRPYQLNQRDFDNFSLQQKQYFANPELLGKRYELWVV